MQKTDMIIVVVWGGGWSIDRYIFLSWDDEVNPLSLGCCTWCFKTKKKPPFHTLACLLDCLISNFGELVVMRILWEVCVCGRLMTFFFFFFSSFLFVVVYYLLCFALLCFKLWDQASSVNWSSKEILNIMTNRPRVTTTNRPNPNHPNTMAVVPIPLLILPLPKSWTIVLAATAAVCCHITDTNTKTEAMNIVANATCETGRDGNGLTSRSEPSAETSSCHPGKVARRRKVRKASTIAMMLIIGLLVEGRSCMFLVWWLTWGKGRQLHLWMSEQPRSSSSDLDPRILDLQELKRFDCTCMLHHLVVYTLQNILLSRSNRLIQRCWLWLLSHPDQFVLEQMLVNIYGSKAISGRCWVFLVKQKNILLIVMLWFQMC